MPPPRRAVQDRARSPAGPSLWEGGLEARGRRFAIVAARFNQFVVEGLVSGAQETLLRLGAAGEDIALARVPGAFEIPPVARRLVKSGRFDAVICLGAVIRGATPHFDYVAGEAARGVAEVARKADIPVIFGILTTDTVEQAVDRSGAKSGNKGAEAALAAVEMVNLYRLLPGKAEEEPAEDRAPARRSSRARAPRRTRRGGRK
jgi:6,7-dimethyl-8-ribityllumazine synthase